MDHPQIIAYHQKECHFFDRMYKEKELQNVMKLHVRHLYWNKCFRPQKRPRGLKGHKHHQPQTAKNDKDSFLPHNNHNENQNKNNHHHKYYMEKTPFYMFDPYVAQRIQNIVPNAKTIFLLRDPVQRAYSGYKMNYVTCHKKKECRNHFQTNNISFESCMDADIQHLKKAKILQDDFWNLEEEEMELRWLQYWEMSAFHHELTELCGDGYIGRGLYYMQLKRWMKSKPNPNKATAVENNMLVIKSETMRPDPNTNRIDFKQVTDFIGIEEFDVTSTEEIHATKDMGPMKEETRIYLMNLFDPFNKKLVSILGEDWENPWPYDINRNDEQKVLKP